MMEATLIQTNHNGHPEIDLKVYDGDIYHAFTIEDKEVTYSVYRHRGELIAYGKAELVDLQYIDFHITSIIVTTQAYDFEIKPGPNFTFMAYKELRRAMQNK